MTYFAYRVVGKTEYNGFDVPQTPQSFADDTEQRLTDPDFLEGDKRFALVVWALPEGVNHVDDVPPGFGGARQLYTVCWFYACDDGGN